MININIAPEKGGVQPFSSINDALVWAKISEREVVFALRLMLKDEVIYNFDQIEDSWKSLRDKISDSEGSDVGSINFTPAAGVFLRDSQTFQIVESVFNSFGDVAAKGALVGAGISAGHIDWKNVDTSAGILIYKLGVENYLKIKLGNAKTAIDTELESFSRQIDFIGKSLSNMQNELSSLSATVADSSKSANTILDVVAVRSETVISEIEGRSSASHSTLNAMVSDFSLKFADQLSSAGKVIDEGRDKVDAWVKAQVETVRLEAPVQLWNERKSNHEKSAKKLAWFALGAGVIGTVATPIISNYAFGRARLMLADAVPRSEAKSSALAQAGMRPTLHFELIFAGAATLFWLTMFFWLMRILVRRYTVEQRLAVDASGRAAMTQTYLGLIKEKAASDAERPIVLGALFQRVDEGGNGDDGPPATSLASIVAAIVAGKG